MGGVAAQCVALTRSAQCVALGRLLLASLGPAGQGGAPTLSVVSAGADHKAGWSQGAWSRGAGLGVAVGSVQRARRRACTHLFIIVVDDGGGERGYRAPRET